MDRLYILVRSDLNPGLMAAQACHAVAAFADSYPTEHAAWHRGNCNLVVLEVPNEQELLAEDARARGAGALVATFREPDLGETATSSAIMGDAAKRLFRPLGLALRAA